ncbi:MAG TPA: Gfo/Idh/MocA family oxidoreductase [Bryobacterales bacterium]|nr:Gfo/Idh/MocA family oxidoreductase [Bryobacterales bacterium]
MEKVRVGLIGSGFSAELHADALARNLRVEMAACASPNRKRCEKFAKKWNIPKVFTDYRAMLECKDLDLVTVGAPNYLHCRIALDAASAHKHVVIEKPLAMNLDEADQMIAACKNAGVKLMYAEDLCFAPKYVRAKRIVDEGGIGRVFHIRQLEKHFGPHSEWFWDMERSGGGALFDMGCHGTECARWILGKPAVKSVFASMNTYVHKNRTKGEDDSTAIIEFAGGAVAVIENSWAKRGGIEDALEIHGSDGVIYCDLVRGSSMLTYSEHGYGYAVEKAPDTKGWTMPLFDEWLQYGYPDEMAHFVDCVLNDRQPLETGEDGKAVLEVMFACYESAAAGRRIDFPYKPAFPLRPVESWLRSKERQ